MGQLDIEKRLGINIKTPRNVSSKTVCNADESERDILNVMRQQLCAQ
jgi:hypothetical protein